PQNYTLSLHDALPIYSRRSDDLIGRQIEGDIVTSELPVELSRGVQRVILPAVLVIHDDFRVPLRKIEAPAPKVVVYDKYGWEDQDWKSTRRNAVTFRL